MARRYRHLFVLPSTGVLFGLNTMASLALALLSGERSFAVTFVALSASSLLLIALATRVLHAQADSLASFRRVSSVVLGGQVVLLLCALAGIMFSILSGYNRSITNAFVFGAFLSAGFEFLVIRGVFTSKSHVALGISSFQPASALVILRFPDLAGHLDFTPFFFGSAAFLTSGGFVLLLMRRKTKLGFDAVMLFQSFMKTWAGGSPQQLESIIAAHSETVDLTSRVLRFKTAKGDNFFIVLPAVHPGPFHPVGSYNLPGVIKTAFSGAGRAMVLHRPGGHERNLATRADTQAFASELRDFALRVEVSETRPEIRGLVRERIGNATVTALGVEDDVLVPITFSPLGSDDIDAQVEPKLRELAGDGPSTISIIDAHNSLGPTQESLEIDSDGWKSLFQRAFKAESVPFKIGWANSKELELRSGEDITEKGIDLLLFESKLSKQVLILADANNAVPRLREEAANALRSAGYELVEFCTSDSHDLAARGLTVSRGYKALGEATEIGEIIRVVVGLCKMAETRISECLYGSDDIVSRVRVFGSEALDEFARITQSSSEFGSRYLRIGSVSIILMLAASLAL